MKLDPVAQSIVLSDFVIREEGTGKCTIVGCFHSFNFPSFPMVTPFFYVTVALTNLSADVREFDVVVRVESPTPGHVIKSLGAHVGIPSGQDIRDAVMDIPLPVAPFVIPQAGRYKIEVLVNGDIAGQRYLWVKPLTAPSPTQ